MYAKVENGNVVQSELPLGGKLLDGRCVSNYNLLPPETLLAEGWLPLELNKPAYNPNTHILRFDNYTIQQDQVIKNYKAVPFSTETFYNVTRSGVIGDYDGTTGTDNTECIQAAFDYCEQKKCKAYIPSGSYLIKSNIRMPSIEIIAEQDAIIYITDEFIPKQTFPESEFVFCNKNFKTQYDSTANRITLSGVNIICESTQIIPTCILGLANITSLYIDNCNIQAKGIKGMSCLDLYSGVKNAVISNSQFDNLTDAGFGGCVWVRNFTTGDTSNVNMSTENIRISNCIFNKNSQDEAIAIYSARGIVRNCIVAECTVNVFGGKTSHVIAVFPSSSSSGYSGYVEDVKILNNTINISDLLNTAIKIGGTEGINTVDGVNIEGNHFYVNAQLGNIAYIIRNISGRKVTVRNNKAYNTGENRIRYGFSGAECTYNYLEGCVTALYSVPMAEGNEIEESGQGVLTATGKRIVGNIMNNINVGVELNGSVDCLVSQNNITLADVDSSSIFGFRLGSVQSGCVLYSENTVYTLQPRQKSFSFGVDESVYSISNHQHFGVGSIA